MSRTGTSYEQLPQSGLIGAAASPVINSPVCMVSKESSYLFAPWLVSGRAPLWSLVTPWAVRDGGLIVHGCLICSLVRKDRELRKNGGRREEVVGGKGQ